MSAPSGAAAAGDATAAPLPLPFVWSREQMLRYTARYEGERFADGRPRVPDDLLRRMRSVTCEQAWTVLREHGYHCQFEGRWVVTHDDPVLVGRAVTCNFVPHRPDLADAVEAEARARGLAGRDKHWVMDRLVRDDVLVADLLDKQIGGGFIGDNLANLIRAKTGTGVVVWGGTRDLAGILALEDFVVFNRNWDPSTSSSYDQTMIVGCNTPIVVGRAAVLPGDVVLGLKEGVTFVPAHLAGAVVQAAELIQLKDLFGYARLKAGVYTAGQIDAAWTPDITADFQAWVRQGFAGLSADHQETVRHQAWWST